MTRKEGHRELASQTSRAHLTRVCAARELGLGEKTWVLTTVRKPYGEARHRVRVGEGPVGYSTTKSQTLRNGQVSSHAAGVLCLSWAWDQWLPPFF